MIALLRFLEASTSVGDGEAHNFCAIASFTLTFLQHSYDDEQHLLVGDQDVVAAEANHWKGVDYYNPFLKHPQDFYDYHHPERGGVDRNVHPRMPWYVLWKSYRYGCGGRSLRLNSSACRHDVDVQIIGDSVQDIVYVIRARACVCLSAKVPVLE